MGRAVSVRPAFLVALVALLSCHGFGFLSAVTYFEYAPFPVHYKRTLVASVLVAGLTVWVLAGGHRVGPTVVFRIPGTRRHDSSGGDDAVQLVRRGGGNQSNSGGDWHPGGGRQVFPALSAWLVFLLVAFLAIQLGLAMLVLIDVHFEALTGMTENLQLSRVGYVGENLANLAIRILIKEDVALQLKAEGGNGEWVTQVEHVEWRPAQSFWRVAKLANLKPNTTYHYRWVYESGIPVFQPQEDIEYRFQTLPSGKDVLQEKSLDISFTYGSCVFPRFPRSAGGIPGFRTIKMLRPDFSVLLGDIIHADVPEYLGSDVAHYDQKYRMLMSERDAICMFASTPTWFIYDDHEFIHNWTRDESGPSFRHGLRSFFRNLGLTNPPPVSSSEHSLYFDTELGGTAAAVFGMDCRQHRHVSTTGKRISMLGPVQKAHFKEWLLRVKDSHDFKIVFSSVPIARKYADMGTDDSDAWSGFDEERQELLDFIYDNKVNNVVFLTGNPQLVAHTEVKTRLSADNDLGKAERPQKRAGRLLATYQGILEFSTSPLSGFYGSSSKEYVEDDADTLLYRRQTSTVNVGLVRLRKAWLPDEGRFGKAVLVYELYDRDPSQLIWSTEVEAY